MRRHATYSADNEVLCKALCHNISCLIQSMYELNIKPEFLVHTIDPAEFLRYGLSVVGTNKMTATVMTIRHSTPSPC
jgi:hypothetical protein